MEEETFYRTRLTENWHRRFGARRDDPSRMTLYGSALVLGGGAIAIALVARAHMPVQAMLAAIGSMVAGIVLFQVLNRHLRTLERAAFAELDGKGSAKSKSPLYPFAKLAMMPRVRSKQAWVEKRMDDFHTRRLERDRQAELFEESRVRLGSIHGTTERRPVKDAWFKASQR